MRTRSIVVFGAIAVGSVVSCRSEDGVSPSVARAQVQSARPSLVPVDVLGSNHVPPGQACKADGYHLFDFWVGQWDVRGPAGRLLGTNVVKSRLGGCVVEENWVGTGGGLGRSLNFYDASTDKWSQMWVGNSGCASDVVVIEGTIEDGAMVMRGRKQQPNGYVLGPPCFPPPGTNSVARNNVIRWTLMPTGVVLQQFTASNNDDPLPALPPASSGAGLHYNRVASVTPLNPATQSLCPSSAPAHQFDFMIGTWNIHEGNGTGAKGTATYTKSMNDCLIEENVSGPGQYEGLSYNTFDVYTNTWRRTYVDVDGVRLFLEGTLVNGSLVLSGAKQGSASGRVRVSWIPQDADRVVQRWEFSRDGSEWSNAKELVFTRE